MRLETFFEKFETLAEMPGAVGKLRELVLDLAVRGGLVPNLPDESAVPYESVEDATPINAEVVPSNWRVVLLADAIKNRSGNSKLIKGKLHDQPGPGRFQGFSASGADVWCDEYEHEGQAIIVSAVGARCGKAFKASGRWSAIANTNIARPESALLDFDFAYLILNNENFWVRGGSAQPFVKFPPSLNRYFATPPLAQQKRIVAKVDELMALCDRLEAQRQERETRHTALTRAAIARFADAPTPANLQLLFHPSYTITPADLRKSILPLAVQGKLVPQNPSDEPADVSLGLIAQQLGRSKGKRTTNKGMDTADEAKPFELPTGWAWSCFPDLGEFGRGKSRHRPRNDRALFDGGNHRLIQTGDVARANGIIETHTGLYNDTGLAQSKLWPAGTLCITIAANIADSGILGFDACFPDSIVGFIPAHPIPSARYFEYFMRTAKEGLEQFAPATAQKNINLGILDQMWVPVPPNAEQCRIVTKVTQLMTMVDKLEAQLAESRSAASVLLTELVSELVH